MSLTDALGKFLSPSHRALVADGFKVVVTGFPVREVCGICGTKIENDDLCASRNSSVVNAGAREIYLRISLLCENCAGEFQAARKVRPL